MGHFMFGRVALAAAAAVMMTAAAEPAAAQEEHVCQTESGDQVAVVADAFIQGYVSSRLAGDAVQIAVNEERGGVGLGRQTKEWLFERQCFLAQQADGSTPVGPGGALDFSLIQQQEADCYAFTAIAERYDGQRNALSVIDRDVSAQARGSYWEASLGQLRNVASAACL